jgi:hypothetical protein
MLLHGKNHCASDLHQHGSRGFTPPQPQQQRLRTALSAILLADRQTRGIRTIFYSWI